MTPCSTYYLIHHNKPYHQISNPTLRSHPHLHKLTILHSLAADRNTQSVSPAIKNGTARRTLKRKLVRAGPTAHGTLPPTARVGPPIAARESTLRAASADRHAGRRTRMAILQRPIASHQQGDEPWVQHAAPRSAGLKADIRSSFAWVLRGSDTAADQESATELVE
ncbi:hypothetical protein SVAN01_05833 [Stagonosporopsis vannaccii]|nr:hypothetical protein SVAN01_05833 [Stagonosporopsis vannaccii]